MWAALLCILNNAFAEVHQLIFLLTEFRSHFGQKEAHKARQNKCRRPMMSTFIYLQKETAVVVPGNKWSHLGGNIFRLKINVFLPLSCH